MRLIRNASRRWCGRSSSGSRGGSSPHSSLLNLLLFLALKKIRRCGLTSGQLRRRQEQSKLPDQVTCAIVTFRRGYACPFVSIHWVFGQPVFALIEVPSQTELRLGIPKLRSSSQFPCVHAYWFPIDCRYDAVGGHGGVRHAFVMQKR